VVAESGSALKNHSTVPPQEGTVRRKKFVWAVFTPAQVGVVTGEAVLTVDEMSMGPKVSQLITKLVNWFAVVSYVKEPVGGVPTF
jgi:hypothetical protein